MLSRVIRRRINSPESRRRGAQHHQRTDARPGVFRPAAFPGTQLRSGESYPPRVLTCLMSGDGELRRGHPITTSV